MASTTEMAAAVNCRARQTSPDWIKYLSSLSFPVVRFWTMSEKFACSMLGSKTYDQSKKTEQSIIVSRATSYSERKCVLK